MEYIKVKKNSTIKPLLHVELNKFFVPINVIQDEENNYNYDLYILDLFTGKEDMDAIVNELLAHVGSFTNQIVQSQDLDDNAALGMSSYFPVWHEDINLKVGEKCYYNGALYERKQPSNPHEVDPPSIDTLALWRRIEENHAGTKNDPIPYSIGVSLVEGKYYKEEDKLYLCTRELKDTAHALKNLVGHYVQLVEE